MSDKIQFLCPDCRTQLAVASQYAGQQAKCPGCDAIVSVPTEDLEETAPYSAPWSPPPSRSSAETSGFGGNQPSSSVSTFGPITDESHQFGESEGAAPPHTPPTTFGRSFLGLLAAIFVGGVCAAIWLAVILIVKVEVGILAWGIGALIGFVAGSIAKNPSGFYCFLVACVAGFSILASKIIMVVFLMVAFIGMDIWEDVQDQLLSSKYEHAYVDQQLAENKYPVEQVELAESFNRGYFEQHHGPSVVINGRELGAFNIQMDPTDQTMSQFRRGVREAVAKAAREEKESWIDNARKRHPEWIIDTSHATAAKILLISEPGELDDDLKRQAEFEIRSSDYLLQLAGQSDDYLSETNSDTVDLRSKTLRTLVIAKLKQLDRKALDELTKEAVAKDSNFVADEIGFIAILDHLFAKGELPAELRDHANGRIRTMTDAKVSVSFLSNLGEKAFVEREIALRKIVSPVWVASTKEEIDERIAETKLRHPNWDPDSTNPPFVASDELKEQIGDGTFAGSFRKVFSLSDALWLFLGFVSAFGTARSRADRTT